MSKGVGVIKERECRDVLFLVALVLFWIGQWVVAGIAFDNGDPRKLWYPKDGYNNTCGLGEFKDREFLVFPDITDFDVQLCVSECPIVGDVGELSCSSSNQICLYGVEPSGSISPLNPSDECWCTYASEPLLRRCFPQDLSETGEETANEIQAVLAGRDNLSQAFTDVSSSWEVILGSTVFSVGLCFMWLIMISIAAYFMVWWTILGIIVCALAACGWLWAETTEFRANNSKPSNDEPDSFVDTGSLLLGLSLTVTIITVGFILAIIFMRKKINLAIGIVKEASRAVRSMPSIIFFPILIFGILVGFFAWWLAAAIYLASMEETATYDRDDLRFMRVYHLFGFFWTSSFLTAVNQTTLAGAIALWYWTSDKSYLPASPVMTSFQRTLRYSLGSLAFGSLILAVVQTIRAMVAMMQKKLKNKDNQCVQFILSCIQCCILCVERFLRFFSKNAYIIVAIQGTGFCTSARTSFKLIINNILRVAAVSFVGDFVIFVGKLSVSIMAGIVAAQVLKDREDVSVWLFPVIVVMVFSYLVASAFMAVYEIAVDTLLLSFLLEVELQQSSNAPSTVFMSASLREFMDKTYQESQKEMDEEENSRL